MNSMPDWQVKRMPCVSAAVLSLTARVTARSTSHHSLTIMGLAVRQASTNGLSSSSFSPISMAPIALSAPTEPP